MDIEVTLAVIFVIALCIFLILKRKELALQKVAFPFIYLILYKTKFGLRLMDKIATRYREHVKLFGYISIGVGYIGMFFISYSVLALIFRLIFQPAVTESGMMLVLPFTSIPGIGFLPFTDWLISIFILAIVHEFAHGVVARAHGLNVTSSGFAFLALFIPIIPAAFVEPDEKRMKKEEDIVQYSVLSAGPTANIILGLLILLISTLIIFPAEAKITVPVGFSFDVVNSSVPAAAAGLTSSIIIDSYNGKKVKGYEEFYFDISNFVKPGEKIILGSGDKTYEITTASNDKDPTKPMIGVKNIKNEIKVKDKYKWLAPILARIKSLFKWLFLLNLFIGLANLLPLGIVDGGRMLQVTLHKLIKNKEKAHKIWVIIAVMFLIFLVFGLITNYIGNPFALLG